MGIEDERFTPRPPTPEEEEYLEFARDRMASRASKRQRRARRTMQRSLLFSMIGIFCMLVIYFVFYYQRPAKSPIQANSSQSTMIGGKKFVPLDTFHIAPNVEVLQSGK